MVGGGGGGEESGLPLCKHDSFKFNPVSTDTIWHSRVIERELRPYRMTSLVVVEVVANNANNNAANTFLLSQREREREKKQLTHCDHCDSADQQWHCYSMAN